MNLSLEALGKRFGSTVAVQDLSLEVPPGEFLSLLGPSGCGKTTTLRMIAGFEAPTSGRILLGSRDMTALPPQRRGMGMVFQNYALFPHLDVYENVAFGLKAKSTPAADIRPRVLDALARVDLTGYEKRSVQALSGGQQQRVALARALAPEPPLLLLDEPLSNLDAALRERTREELRALLKRIGMTAIFVTHDQEEAFALSDRIAVLREGVLQQHGTPEELYRTPVNPFVAAFVGRANFIEGRILSNDGQDGVVEVAGGARWRVRLHAGEGGKVRVMVRPEALRLADPQEAPDAERGLRGRVLDRRFAGANTVYRVEAPGAGELLVTIPGHGGDFAGEVVVTAEQDPPLHAFPAE
jgi:ABC-type Fe3+/spermidine/putrescine transport system ATPase subunit